jgi:hypothetical protein
MLSLSKKSDDQSDVEPHWHSNFRNVERLPDTKVIRTTFFVNTAAIAVCLGLLIWTGYREYHIRTLDQQIAEAQQQIDSNLKHNREALKLSQTFIAEEKKLTDAENFVRAPIAASEFINLLGQALPVEISIEYVEVRLNDPRNQVFMVRGVVAGTRDQASGSASSYVDLLRNHPQLGKIFEPITLERLNPDGATGFLAFEISMKVKPEGKKQ